ncbi:hypothetical protein A4R63_09550 [Corynebacterium pseudotuberculosis]|nr:hypothetical protein A4R72_09785 [Corynebacterium pseudotuberculosis]APB13715.1 hypothetical protein A4R71_09800 [Corynebacterium pseudotuberculosis]APB15758.1 hypothetical protein A4R68_09800 [Corynebacterium pseudotuberculosis]APB17803.1 hypothetical protein A4R67_09775 [Corynebacterium pseudotuberculosis]APB19851.1 hypothetical protein A4R66_09775 [Corynebacterium pseudotuberculosis]
MASFAELRKRSRAEAVALGLMCRTGACACGTEQRWDRAAGWIIMVILGSVRVLGDMCKHMFWGGKDL